MRDNLRNARKKAGYTQAELSAVVGITTNQYQRLEAGTTDGSIKVWVKLVKVLDAPNIDYLYASTT